MVGLGGPGGHDDDDADDEAEHKGDAEPEVVIESSVVLGVRNGQAHERDEPRKLSTVTQLARKLCR